MFLPILCYCFRMSDGNLQKTTIETDNNFYFLNNKTLTETYTQQSEIQNFLFTLFFQFSLYFASFPFSSFSHFIISLIISSLSSLLLISSSSVSTPFFSTSSFSTPSSSTSTFSTSYISASTYFSTSFFSTSTFSISSFSPFSFSTSYFSAFTYFSTSSFSISTFPTCYLSISYFFAFSYFSFPYLTTSSFSTSSSFPSLILLLRTRNCIFNNIRYWWKAVDRSVGRKEWEGGQEEGKAVGAARRTFSII